MSNGKKLGVKSKVSDNYLVTGNDYEKFQEALHDMDNRTVIIPVRNPESMRIHCVIAKSDKEHASPRFVVLDPMEMKDSILLSDESIFFSRKMQYRKIQTNIRSILILAEPDKRN